VTGRLHLGTSGFAYPAWKGTFYPEKLPASGFLGFYADRFDTVEINNTFYRFPSEKVLAGWKAGTPEGFTFAVKANQRITHFSRLRDAGKVTGEFVARVGALEDRLGPVLFQLPPVLQRDDDRLGAFLGVLPPGGRYALEFRHASWFERPVLDLLSRAGAALCISEDGDLDPPREITAPFTYVRLRRETYDDAALAAWRTWMTTARGEGRDVYVYLKHEEAGASPEGVLGRLRDG
jgi:uncharacterized protein YecE (DUF72 family)